MRTKNNTITRYMVGNNKFSHLLILVMAVIQLRLLYLISLTTASIRKELYLNKLNSSNIIKTSDI
jgi:hypothetical protein